MSWPELKQGGRYLTLEQRRGMVQEVEGLGQRQGQAGGRLTAVQEYDLQHFAAQKVALHGGKEHLSAWRR